MTSPNRRPLCALFPLFLAGLLVALLAGLPPLHRGVGVAAASDCLSDYLKLPFLSKLGDSVLNGGVAAGVPAGAAHHNNNNNNLTSCSHFMNTLADTLIAKLKLVNRKNAQQPIHFESIIAGSVRLYRVKLMGVQNTERACPIQFQYDAVLQVVTVKTCAALRDIVVHSQFVFKSFFLGTFGPDSSRLLLAKATLMMEFEVNLSNRTLFDLFTSILAGGATTPSTTTTMATAAAAAAAATANEEASPRVNATALPPPPPRNSSTEDNDVTTGSTATAFKLPASQLITLTRLQFVEAATIEYVPERNSDISKFQFYINSFLKSQGANLIYMQLARNLRDSANARLKLLDKLLADTIDFTKYA